MPVLGASSGAIIVEGFQMNYEKEVHSLGAETLALRAVVIFVCARLAEMDSKAALAIGRGFDDAASFVDYGAVAWREGVMSGQRVEASRIIEELRGLCLGNQQMPPHQ
jgi:hypothetical protein